MSLELDQTRKCVLCCIRIYIKARNYSISTMPFTENNMILLVKVKISFQNQLNHYFSDQLQKLWVRFSYILVYKSKLEIQQEELQNGPDPGLTRIHYTQRLEQDISYGIVYIRDISWVKILNWRCFNSNEIIYNQLINHMKNQMIALMKTKKNNKNIISSKSVIKYKSMLPTKYLLLTEKKSFKTSR